jgi:hypothetical protein
LEVPFDTGEEGGELTMIQGTTPTHQFTIPMDATVVQMVRVVYAQKDKVLLVKEGDECQRRAV